LAIEPEHLDEIAAPAAEDEDVTRERTQFQRGLHHRAQPGKSATHVGYARHDPDARVRRKRDHPRKYSNTMRSVVNTLGMHAGSAQSSPF
jgi:hypothetical protein